MLRTQQAAHKEEGDNSNQNRGEIGAAGQRLQQRALVGIFLRLNEERADDGAQDAQRRHDHGDGHSLERLIGKRSHTQSGSRDNGTDIGFIQVGAHAGHIAYIIAHVVGDNGGVAGIVLGDAGFYLAHQISTHIGSLGENTAAHTGKQCHGAGAHAKGQHGAGNIRRLQLEHKAQQHKPDGNVQQTQSHHGEAHHRAGGKGHAQALIQAIAAGIGRAAVGLGGNPHAHKTAEAGKESAGQKSKGNKPCQQLAGCHDAQHHDHAGKENAHHRILPTQISIRTLADRTGDLAHQRRSLVKAQHASTRDKGKQQCDDRANKCGQNQVFFHKCFPLSFPHCRGIVTFLLR